MAGAKTKKPSRGTSNALTAPTIPEPDKIWMWWRKDADSPPRCREEVEDLPSDIQGLLAQNMQRYLAGESRRHDVDHLGDGLFELRVRKGSNHYRILFMKWGHVSVGLTAFYKNTQQTPKSAIKRAHERATSWRSEFGDAPVSR